MGLNKSEEIMLCSERLTLHLRSASGRQRMMEANLEEIWSSGALFQTDEPIRPFTQVTFAGGGHQFRGEAVLWTCLRRLGYFVEVRFKPSCQWSAQEFRPKHLFNPQVLVTRAIFGTGPIRPGSPTGRLQLCAQFASMASFVLDQTRVQ